MTITKELILDIFNYEKITGKFFYKKTKRGTKAGQEAGTNSRNPKENKFYRRITINNKSYPRSHLIWLVEKGVFPTLQLDHINDDSLDDRIENLQELTNADNNRRKTRLQCNNTSGYTGVNWSNEKNKWRAQFGVTRDLLPDHLKGKGKSEKRTFHIGYFNCPKEAHQAYLKKKEEILAILAK